MPFFVEVVVVVGELLDLEARLLVLVGVVGDGALVDRAPFGAR
jgi:hypothetical protein